MLTCIWYAYSKWKLPDWLCKLYALTALSKNHMRIPRTILKLFNQMLLLLFMYIRKIEVFIYTLFWMDTSNITFYGADSWEKE